MNEWGVVLELCLLHFVWQGAAVFVLCAAVCRLTGSARARYAFLCTALVGLSFAPIATSALIRPSPGQSLPFDPASGLPLVALWVAGAFIGLIHLAISLSLLGRFRPSGPLDPVLEKTVSAWANRLGFRLPVRIVAARGLSSPAVAGVFKATLYVPLGLMARLSPAQVEALIVHELVHLKRLDPLVNLVQSCIERIYFFHPAIWWISDQIRIEREVLCDEATVELVSDRVVYASALAALVSEAVTPSPKLSVAASGGHLVDRIARILGVRRTPQRRREHVRVGMASLVGCLFFFGFTLSVPLGRTADILAQAERLRIAALAQADEAANLGATALHERDRVLHR